MKKITEIIPSKSHQNPISCSTHDYLETACIYRYEVIIALRNSEIIKGAAKTTVTKANKIEYLVVESKETLFEVPMTEISQLKVITVPAMFRVIEFE